MAAAQRQGTEASGCDKATSSDHCLNLYAPFPVTKLSQPRANEKEKAQVVLVATGSFNPPTYMHLQMFELAKDRLVSRGKHVLGGYMSPVNDGFGKLGLVSAEHRIKMCQLATVDSAFIMVDPWEALQQSYQRTLTVLAHVADALRSVQFVNSGALQVMLLCGADLVESFTIPNVWIPDQVEEICRDYGIACVPRGNKDLEEIISKSSVLSRHKENILIVDGFVSDISSTMARENLSEGVSTEQLIPVNVINYIKSNSLYDFKSSGR